MVREDEPDYTKPLVPEEDKTFPEPTVPESSKIESSNVKVDNFYKYSKKINSFGDRLILEDKDFEVVYFPKTDAFLISVLASPFYPKRLEAEKKLKAQFPNLPLTIIRPPIVYGPRDSNFLMFFKFAKRGIFLVPPPYERYFSIVYVKDLVEGIYSASQFFHSFRPLCP